MTVRCTAMLGRGIAGINGLHRGVAASCGVLWCSLSGCIVTDPSYLDPSVQAATQGTRGGPSGSTSAASNSSVASSSTRSSTSGADGGSSTSGTDGGSSSDSSPTTGLVREGMMLWTTLEGPDSVTMPMVGDATLAQWSTMPDDDFVMREGGGIVIDEPGEWLRYRQVAGQANIEFDRGTVEFGYQPNYDHDDGQRHQLVVTVDSSSNLSGLHIRKGMNGRFSVLLYDQTGAMHTTSVSSANYEWFAGQRILIRVIWETTGLPQDQGVRIYFDGDEASPYETMVGADIPMGSEDPGGWLYIGARSEDTTNVASGVIDEFIVYDEPRAPGA